MKTIKPCCELFEIRDYDYVINRPKGIERLVLEGQAIGCLSNSIDAIVLELINYIWINTYADKRCIGAFEKQTMNVLKKYWIKEK